MTSFPNLATMYRGAVLEVLLCRHFCRRQTSGGAPYHSYLATPRSAEFYQSTTDSCRYEGTVALIKLVRSRGMLIKSPWTASGALPNFAADMYPLGSAPIGLGGDRDDLLAITYSARLIARKLQTKQTNLGGSVRWRPSFAVYFSMIEWARGRTPRSRGLGAHRVNRALARGVWGGNWHKLTACYSRTHRVRRYYQAPTRRGRVVLPMGSCSEPPHIDVVARESQSKRRVGIHKRGGLVGKRKGAFSAGTTDAQRINQVLRRRLNGICWAAVTALSQDVGCAGAITQNSGVGVRGMLGRRAASG
ncbi:hypothetical protein C8R46DRAFT_1028592 [Mycena filopes]|nr:hypothetical protein C8R46DRAFT_1028592 [Mycena filopes]